MILFPSTLKYCPNVSVFAFIFNLRPAADSIACLSAQNNFLSQSSFLEGCFFSFFFFLIWQHLPYLFQCLFAAQYKEAIPKNYAGLHSAIIKMHSFKALHVFLLVFLFFV